MIQAVDQTLVRLLGFRQHLLGRFLQVRRKPTNQGLLLNEPRAVPGHQGLKACSQLPGGHLCQRVHRQ